MVSSNIIHLNHARLVAAQEQRDILNRAEAAAYLNIAPGTLTSYVKRGAIPCQKVARRVIFSRRALERWAACENNPAPVMQTADGGTDQREDLKQ
ncbi:MAG: helix-turn-helix domain-containing protein [Thermoguttaceae bacterium]|nr:helix-turn-helix domain-containing protein [Thermoguttaceae bacterium]